MECGQSFISSWPEKWRLFANLNYSVCHREMQLLTFLTSPCCILISVSLLPLFCTTMSQWCLSWLLCKAAADWESKALHFFFPSVAALHNFGWNEWKNPCLLQQDQDSSWLKHQNLFQSTKQLKNQWQMGGMSLPNPSLVHLSGILHNARVSA